MLRPYLKYHQIAGAIVSHVPDHWKLERCDSVAPTNRNQINPENISQARVFHYSIPNVQAFGTGAIEETTDVESNKLLIKQRQLLVSRLNPRKSTLAIAEPHPGITTIASSEFVPLIPKKCDVRYLYYLFSSEHVRQYLSSRVESATRSHQRVAVDDIAKLPWFWPTSNEQVAIAAYLERATAKIDALTAKKRRFIELLEEKRAALITKAVTSGLERSSRLKETGVAWLAQIPNHWDFLSLARISLSRCDGPFGSGLKSDHYTDSGVRVVRLQNIGFAKFSDEDKAYIDSEYAKELGDHSVRPGDLLIAGLGDEGHPVGRACEAPADIEPALVKADCFRFRLDRRRVLPRFAAYQLSAVASAMAGSLSTGATRARINLSVTATRKLALPPLHEQEEIVSFLDDDEMSFELLRSRTSDAISLLSEYRSALITAAVTGKIDVREASAMG